MTTALAHDNGTAKPKPVKPQEVEMYHGVPVLHLRVGDPVPTPRAPIIAAVRVTPDLARHLLTVNHEHNRNLRPGLCRKYAREMDAGRWRFLPEPIAFSITPTLENGQHRLMAVTEHGQPVWMLFTFGWPAGIINAMDRGATKNNADALRVEGIPRASIIAAVIAKSLHYEATVGTTRGWSGLATPSSLASLEIHAADPDGWLAAARAGDYAYTRLDKSLSQAWWGAAYRVIAYVDPQGADAFFTEVVEGTGTPRSATRQLADFYRRRMASQTRTGDDREPIENIIRAFNAWKAGKSVGMVTRIGFALSRVRA